MGLHAKAGLVIYLILNSLAFALHAQSNFDILFLESKPNKERTQKMTRSANPINWNIQAIAETINTINGIDWQIVPATVGCDECLQVTRDSDGEIMELTVIPDDEETFIGFTTYIDAECQEEGAYSAEGAVTVDKVEEMVKSWAS